MGRWAQRTEGGAYKSQHWEGPARRGKTDSAQIVGAFPILIFSLGKGGLAGRMCLQLYLAGGGGGGDKREDEPKLLE